MKSNLTAPVAAYIFNKRRHKKLQIKALKLPLEPVMINKLCEFKWLYK